MADHWNFHTHLHNVCIAMVVEVVQETIPYQTVTLKVRIGIVRVWVFTCRQLVLRSHSLMDFKWLSNQQCYCYLQTDNAIVWLSLLSRADNVIVCCASVPTTPVKNAASLISQYLFPSWNHANGGLTWESHILYSSVYVCVGIGVELCWISLSDLLWDETRDLSLVRTLRRLKVVSNQ